MPESIGKILKRIRESMHFSIEEVSKRSRIHRNIVSTIEEDRLNEIESGFYAKSFVKTYAAFLGALDESGIREYLAKPVQQPQKKPETISKPVARPVSGTAQQKSLPVKEMPQVDFPNIAKYKKIAFSDNSNMRFSVVRKVFYTFLYHKKQILAIVAGVLIFWALSLAIGHVVRFIKNIPAKRQIKSAVVKKEEPKITEKLKPKSAIKDVKKETPGEKSDHIEIEVTSSDNTWLQVIADGELMFTGSFKKGSKDAWKARKEIKIEAGNSGVIRININGKPASFSGKRGEKKEITITKDGIKN